MTTTKFTPAEALHAEGAALFATPCAVALDVPLDVLTARLRWACGQHVLTDPALIWAAVEDVAGDARLCAALHLQPEEFAAWLLQDDLSIYCLTDATGSEEWAIHAARRVRGFPVWPRF
jgi:hypothetical protein